MGNNACLRNGSVIAWAVFSLIDFLLLPSICYILPPWLSLFLSTLLQDFCTYQIFFIIRSQNQSACVTSKNRFTYPQRFHSSQLTAAFEKEYKMSSQSIPQGIQVLCKNEKLRHWPLTVVDTILQARTNPNSHNLFSSLSCQHFLYIPSWIECLLMNSQYLLAPLFLSMDIAASSSLCLQKCT